MPKNFKRFFFHFNTFLIFLGLLSFLSCGKEEKRDCDKIDQSSSIEDKKACGKCNSVHLLDQLYKGPEVSMSIKLERCDSDQIDRVSKENLIIYENQLKGYQDEEAWDFVKDPKNFKIYITLLLDMSGSMSNLKDELIKVANEFSFLLTQGNKKSNFYIRIAWFDKKLDAHFLGEASNNYSVILENIEKLKTINPIKSSTNLNQSLLTTVKDIEDKIALEKGKENLTQVNGSVVLLSDGQDRADFITHTELMEKLKLRSPFISIYSLAFQSNDYNPVNLKEISGEENYFLFNQVSDISGVFKKVAGKIQVYNETFYILKYCAHSIEKKNVPLEVQIQAPHFQSSFSTFFDAPTYEDSLINCNLNMEEENLEEDDEDEGDDDDENNEDQGEEDSQTDSDSSTSPPAATSYFIKQLGLESYPQKSSGTDQAKVLKIDNKGDMYITGETLGKLGEMNGGQADVFLAKISSEGNLLWMKQLGSSLGDKTSGSDEIYALDIDPVNQHIYIAGATTGSLGENKSGNEDGFIAKFTAQGNLLWIKQLGSVTMKSAASEKERIKSLKVDASGNIYFSGITYGPLVEPLSRVYAGSFDAFVGKLNPSGNLLWIKQLGSTTDKVISASSSETADTLEIDHAGAIYLSGTVFGVLDRHELSGSGDPYFVKFNASGDILQIKQIGKNTLGINTAGGAINLGFQIDPLGNLYFAGNTNSKWTDGTNQSNDVYLIKLNSSGKLIFLKQYGVNILGHQASFNETVSSFRIDKNENFIIGGSTTGNFGETNAGSIDAYIMKISSAGNLLWIKQFGRESLGSSMGTREDFVTSVQVDEKNNIYFTGHTWQIFTENNGGGLRDIIFGKINPSGRW